ncbi:MAG: ABC transporter ATP-binding protein [Deltaproteobacteria bacterium]|jgi:lipoprotein-releasing system ATP-binding protein|nr:ABC transporter ATP-binding protein [Deltaproteobacteria bacterium]
MSRRLLPAARLQPAPAPAAGAVLLEARSLTKRFQSGGAELTILSGLDLAVPEGRSVAVLGASGSGKSSLLYLLGGLDRPTEGQVLSRGVNIFSGTDEERASWRSREVGFVFQYHHLLPEFEALENVAMPALLAGINRSQALDLAKPLLDRVGLSQRYHHRPGALSGGEQQRAALARALVMAPKVLLADEPTGNLDARNAALINDLISELVGERKMSAVVVTHNTVLARQMERRLELIQGRLQPWTG